jgi:hypothetical protein
MPQIICRDLDYLSSRVTETTQQHNETHLRAPFSREDFASSGMVIGASANLERHMRECSICSALWTPYLEDLFIGVSG